MQKSIRVLSRTSNRMELLFEGFEPEEVNAIRRLILSDVPTLAIDFIYVYDNSSPVPDEIIAHRLGLLVLDSKDALENLKSPEECSEASEEDRECYVKMILEAEVADNAETGRYVMAGEIQVDTRLTRIVYPETPITYLAPGQRLHLVAYARLGRGREHGKWSPASVAISQYLPVVYYDSSKATEECLECVAAYPEIRGALEKGGTGRIEVLGNVNTSGLHYCSEAACKDALRLEYDENRIILAFESTGSLPPERIALEAVKALARRAERVRSLIEQAQGGG